VLFCRLAKHVYPDWLIFFFYSDDLSKEKNHLSKIYLFQKNKVQALFILRIAPEPSRKNQDLRFRESAKCKKEALFAVFFPGLDITIEVNVLTVFKGY